MTEIFYGVITEKYTVKSKVRTAYGIAAYADIEEAGSATIVSSVRDISANKAFVEELAKKCNTYKLSAEHLSDVVMDAVNDYTK